MAPTCYSELLQVSEAGRLVLERMLGFLAMGCMLAVSASIGDKTLETCLLASLCQPRQ
jgi:hypothetical protein